MSLLRLGHDLNSSEFRVPISHVGVAISSPGTRPVHSAKS